MAAGRPRISSRIVFAWFMIAGLIFFFAPQSWTGRLQLTCAKIAEAPLRAGRTLSSRAETDSSAADVVSRAQYDMLRNRLANVTQWLSDERQKVEELSRLSNRPIWKGASFLQADVIKVSMTDSFCEMIINRGSDEGIGKGQYVLGDESIIGTVSQVAPRIAKVRLITDPESKLAVKIADEVQAAGSGKKRRAEETESLMHGMGNNSAKILLLPAKYKVTLGSTVYVRKNPGLLDTAIMAATVTQCGRDAENPLIWDIKVEPACNIKALEHVVVIIMNPKP